MDVGEVAAETGAIEVEQSGFSESIVAAWIAAAGIGMVFLMMEAVDEVCRGDKKNDLREERSLTG